MMKTVLVTGGIGSGKTEVCRYLESKGVPVYYSDAEAKNLYDRVPGLVEELELRLGCDLRGEGVRLDKRKLSDIIFSDKAKLELVESIVHPVLLEDFGHWRDRLSEKYRHEIWESGLSVGPFVVMESAIALEKPVFSNYFDAVIIVEAPAELRMERVLSRDKLTLGQIDARTSVQITDLTKADFVIWNTSDIDGLHKEVENAFEYLSL